MGTYDFRGKNVLVTGAGARIGRGIAACFARTGARLVLNDVDSRGLDETVGMLEGASETLTCVGDIADPATIEGMLELAERDGAPDVLVNNAGLVDTSAPFLETTLEDWDRIHRVNLRAVYLATLATTRRMVQLGIAGAIVNLSSPGAQRAHHDNALYDAAKGGVEALTRCVAVDLGRYGIRCNAIAPAAVSDQPQPPRRAGAPLGRGASPEDVGRAAVFLASDDAAMITGHALNVDGGVLAQLRTPSG